MTTIRDPGAPGADLFRKSAVQLARLGVILLNSSDLTLKCVTCGSVWSLSAPEAELPMDYWVCPNKCNL